MGDEYVSVEHLFLAMIRYPNRAIKEIFKEYGITRDRFLQALSTVRGNQRVMTDNPEATYDTLEKYGYDMVERARDQKLDPVIDKEDDLAIGILNLIQNGFQTFLKLTTIFCTGDQCTHIQGKQLLVLQSFRYIPADNSLCQTLYG